MSTFTNKTQFDFLFDALAQKYPGIQNTDGKTSMFQFVRTPLSADWRKNNSYEAYSLANAGSLSLDGFYTRSYDLDEAYSTLIMSIKPAKGDSEPDYLKLMQKYSAVIDQISVIKDEAQREYNVWIKSHTNPDGTAELDFSKWLLDPFGGEDWNARMISLKSERDRYMAEANRLYATLDKPLQDALESFKSDTMEVSPTPDKCISVPRVTISGNLSSDMLRWLKYAPGEYDFQVEINSNQKIINEWKTTINTEITKQCFTTSIHTTIDTVRIITDTNYNLKYKAVGLNSYNIERGKWFRSSYVDPAVQFSPAASVNNNTFFGLNGSLHLLPMNILVMYKPELELTISKQCYQQQFSQYANQDIEWIEIFGSRFNFGESKRITPIDVGNNAVKIVMKSPEQCSPQVIGITSAVKYNGNK